MALSERRTRQSNSDAMMQDETGGVRRGCSIYEDSGPLAGAEDTWIAVELCDGPHIRHLKRDRKMQLWPLSSSGIWEIFTHEPWESAVNVV